MDDYTKRNLDRRKKELSRPSDPKNKTDWIYGHQAKATRNSSLQKEFNKGYTNT